MLVSIKIARTSVCRFRQQQQAQQKLQARIPAHQNTSLAIFVASRGAVGASRRVRLNAGGSRVNARDKFFWSGAAYFATALVSEAADTPAPFSGASSMGPLERLNSAAAPAAPPRVGSLALTPGRGGFRFNTGFFFVSKVSEGRKYTYLTRSHTARGGRIECGLVSCN